MADYQQITSSGEDYQLTMKQERKVVIVSASLPHGLETAICQLHKPGDVFSSWCKDLGYAKDGQTTNQ